MERSAIMGGRGAHLHPRGSSTKRAKVAKIPRAKLKDYLLHPEKSKGKHKVFNAIGYNQGNWKKLEKDLRDGLKKGKLKPSGNADDGTTLFTTKMKLGINSKRKFVTVWAVRDKKGRLHFVTGY